MRLDAVDVNDFIAVEDRYVAGFTNLINKCLENGMAFTATRRMDKGINCNTFELGTHDKPFGAWLALQESQMLQKNG